MTVAELIAVLQKFDSRARVVATFSPNAFDINVEEVGGATYRNQDPFAGAIELTRTGERQRENTKQSPEAVSDDALALIREADSDAPV